jgi:hypothetical protein
MALFRLRERFNELRKSPRHQLHYLAHIDAGDPTALLSCIISDISGNGAKLTVGGLHSVPDQFTLVFRRHCRVVRRDDGQIGVVFV